jgi:uncharacterized protein (TIGR03066 family)
VRNDWQANRDQIREDWQQHRDEARDDWQDHFDDHYGYYGGWYGGYASGYWSRWDTLWDNYPVAAAAGLTWWGANALGYMFGYSDYYNPYYTESMPVYYSEPVITMPAPVEAAPPAAGAPPQPPAPVSSLPPGVSEQAVDKFDQARDAFYDRRYEEALKLSDEAVAQMPRDAVLHEFRSLVLFALRRYQESAAAIHAVLDVGPGWDWKTLSSLYPSNDVYKDQLQQLESACEKNPAAADLRFLLGYHYLTCCHLEDAAKMFRRVVELQPNDTVAAALLASVSPNDAPPAAPGGERVPDAIPADKIVGSWTAAGPKAATYSMTLAKDGTFTWTFNRGARKEQAKGVYTIEGNVLAMEPDSGGIMLAEMSTKDDGGLHFKMVGGPKDDKGLDFRRRP